MYLSSQVQFLYTSHTHILTQTGCWKSNILKLLVVLKSNSWLTINEIEKLDMKYFGFKCNGLSIQRYVKGNESMTDTAVAVERSLFSIRCVYVLMAVKFNLFVWILLMWVADVYEWFGSLVAKEEKTLTRDKRPLSVHGRRLYRVSSTRFDKFHFPRQPMASSLIAPDSSHNGYIR